MTEKAVRRAEALVGLRVKSLYRARWMGTVVRLSDTVEGCVIVAVDTDRCGRPMRKPITKHISAGWLEKLCE